MQHDSNEDYYWENGLMVFTRQYHLKRGYCCGSGCRHCPYRREEKALPRVSVSWSGGKDSAFALYVILSSKEYHVEHLHTVIDADTHRVGMHGIPESLLDRQAEAIGIPLKKIYLPASRSDEVYREKLAEFYKECVIDGIQAVVFGDIFLQDLKAYRELLLKPFQLDGLFPLWNADSSDLISTFLAKGFKTAICAADARYFFKEDTGRTLDKEVLNMLPSEVDPCGENGEFHTFTFDGPIFRRPVPFRFGETFEKTYSYTVIGDQGEPVEVMSSFWFRELISNDD